MINLEKLPSKIQISWYVTDVKDRAEELGISISDYEAKRILQNIYHSHDDNVGINWDVIDSNIHDFKK